MSAWSTEKILQSKKTEKILWVLIIGTFMLSVLLSRYVTTPAKQETASTLIAEVGTISFEEAILQYNKRTIPFQGSDIVVVVAETTEQKIQGLSGTASFPEGINGLLFVYEEPGFPGIWMKDMNYPINIYWLDGRYNVVHQELNVSPETYPETFTTSVPAEFVLETPLL